MMIVQYLLDADAEVTIGAVAAPQTTFADERAPVELALEQERHVTAQIAKLVADRAERVEYVGEQFLGWFLEEQREEVASMSSLLAVVERATHEQSPPRRGVPRPQQHRRSRAQQECTACRGRPPPSPRLGIESEGGPRLCAGHPHRFRPAGVLPLVSAAACAPRRAAGTQLEVVLHGEVRSLRLQVDVVDRRHTLHR